MSQLKQAFGLLCIVIVISALGVAVRAHDVLTEGTITTVAPAKLEISSLNKASNKEEIVAFVIDAKTKVTRGTETVAYTSLTKGDRVVVVVNTDAPTKMLATEVRLQAR